MWSIYLRKVADGGPALEAIVLLISTIVVENTETTVPEVTPTPQQDLSLDEMQEWDLVYISDNSEIDA